MSKLDFHEVLMKLILQRELGSFDATRDFERQDSTEVSRNYNQRNLCTDPVQRWRQETLVNVIVMVGASVNSTNGKRSRRFGQGRVREDQYRCHSHQPATETVIRKEYPLFLASPML